MPLKPVISLQTWQSRPFQLHTNKMPQTINETKITIINYNYYIKIIFIKIRHARIEILHQCAKPSNEFTELNELIFLHNVLSNLWHAANTLNNGISPIMHRNQIKFPTQKQIPLLAIMHLSTECNTLLTASCGCQCIFKLI